MTFEATETSSAAEEVARLQKENDKLKYQILHLKRALKEADEKLASAETK